MAGRPKISFPEQHNLYEEDDIKTYLWSFDSNSQFETLQDIGFELNLTPELMYLSQLPSSSEHMVPLIAGKDNEPMPEHQELPINVATASEENPRGNQGVQNISGMPSAEAERKKRKSRGSMKKRTKKKIEDDDSWMPEGWVKVVKQRPLTGKFPGYEDKHVSLSSKFRGVQLSIAESTRSKLKRNRKMSLRTVHDKRKFSRGIVFEARELKL
ncbi:hypothetical protein BUALT_Bualt07G0073300 [Buddleja alternifolia]|uniref:Uncharacterized protein n=1 Tax=Buddleja alternifolia TaxID=168488 RepID=A0AAV6XGY7_9LAMI|nr:hypothetical protein BUALT_Bualt07G0073300 [Buddleja alternifolia]